MRLSTPPAELATALRNFLNRAQSPSSVKDSTIARNVDVLFCFDGGGAPIGIGAHCYAVVDFPARLNGWFIVADVLGSISFDLNSGPFTSYPTLSPVVSDLGTSPSTAAAQSAFGDVTSGGLTGWTLDVPKGTVIEAIVSNNDTIAVTTLSLRCKRLDIF